MKEEDKEKLTELVRENAKLEKISKLMELGISEKWAKILVEDSNP